MNTLSTDWIKRILKTETVEMDSTLQSLWSGYGSIIRLSVGCEDFNSVILKAIQLNQQPSSHPRGWNTSISHQRKLKSYQVEAHWYEHWSHQCGEQSRVPKVLGVLSSQGFMFILLEDLDAAGFSLRLEHLHSWENLEVCIKWLAAFHACFLHDCFLQGSSLQDSSLQDNPPSVVTRDLWPEGTYWHLATRQDEWQKLPAGALRDNAIKIDEVLSSVRFKTLVHGDAKLANFCFSANQQQVAAVDFQYVGGGCGMKDLAYCVSSMLSSEECECYESKILDTYFLALSEALEKNGKSDWFEAIEKEWRPLYEVAWADFYRFLKGWSPSHWKVHGYSESVAQKVIEQLSKI